MRLRSKTGFGSAAKTKAWYLAPTVVNGVASIASVPLLIMFVGASGWAEIALGQAVGLFGSVFVALGWPVVGPALVARCTPDEQYRQYLLSIWSRLIVAVLVTLVTLAVFIFFWPDRSVLLWTAIATNLLGCASSWYFLGIDDPRGLFWRDAVSRSAGTGFGLFGVAVTSHGEMFPLGVFLGIVLSVLLTYRKVRDRRTGTSPSRLTVQEVLGSIRSQRHGLSTNALFIALSSIALPLTAVVGGQVFVAFAVLDKVQKQLVTVALPLTQLITGRMAGDLGRGAKVLETANRTLSSIIVSGALLCAVMIPLGPLAVEVMSVGSVEIDGWQTMIMALAVGLAFIVQCIPVAVMAPISKLGFSLWGMGIAIVVGVPALYFSARYVGVTAVMMTLCFVYVIPMLFSLIGLRSAKKMFLLPSVSH